MNIAVPPGLRFVVGILLLLLAVVFGATDKLPLIEAGLFALAGVGLLL